jgi:hypothetical protein
MCILKNLTILGSWKKIILHNKAIRQTHPQVVPLRTIIKND